MGTERFLVQRRLGSGAFGVVYEAFDRQEQTLVAIKVLRYADADALYRFKKDFRSLADIRHPNLVAFQELFTEEGLWFFTMELVPGVDFIHYLTGIPADSLSTTTGALPRREADRPEPSFQPPPYAHWPDYDRIRATLVQLVRGLHTVHQHGKLHRDIKPPNVLVTPEGRVVLLDFGLVTELERFDTPAQPVPQLVGTPAYMSPEQALALPGTPASDWYSVGVMLYQALCGELPFQGSLGQILSRKQTQKAPSPRERMPDVPEDLERLCSDLLGPVPEDRPDGAEILRRLEGKAVSEDQREPTETFFVGRKAPLQQLHEAWTASRSEGLAVFLKGPSGIGKSALVERFVLEIHDRDPEAVILFGRCYPQESVPYKALDSLIDALSRYLFGLPRQEAEVLLPSRVEALVRLFPVLQRVEAVADAVVGVGEDSSLSPQVLRRRAFSALRDLLSRLATRRPLILVIDDLQWGDVDSFLLLDKLLELPDPPPLLLLGSYRSEDESSSPFLEALVQARQSSSWAARDVREILLPRLDEGEVDELLERLEGRGVLPQDLGDAVAEAEGNPLFIAELVRYVDSHRDVDRPVSHGGLAELHLRDLIDARVDQLSETARCLLELVAVAGRPLDLQVAREAAGLHSGAAEALTRLRVLKLLRQRAAGRSVEVEAYHDRIRETVVERLSPERKRRLHRDLALALESSGQAEPETLAVHFQATEEMTLAQEYVTTAAQRAEDALAFERAARLYRMALELTPQESRERYQLQVRLGTALANAGRSLDAADTYIQAVVNSGHVNPIEVQRRAAEKLLISGHIQRGLAVLRHVLRTVGMELESSSWRVRARWFWQRWRLRWRGFEFEERSVAECDPDLLRRIDICWSVEVGLCLVDFQHASDFHNRHLLLALEAGEPQRIARGLALEVFFAGMEKGRSRVVLERARELAERVEGTYAVGLTKMAAGMQSVSEGEWAQAYQRLREAEIRLREARKGVAWELDTVCHFRVLAMIHLGQLPEAFEELPHLLDRARDQDNLYLELHLVHWLESIRDLAEDRPGRVLERLEHTLGQWTYEGFHYQHFGHWYAEVQVALYQGEGEKAWQLVKSRWRAFSNSSFQRIGMVRILALDLRARALLGALQESSGRRRGTLDRPWDARRLYRVEAAARQLERMGSSWSLGLASMARAGAYSVTGDRDRTMEQLEIAITAFEVSGMQMHSAVARCCRAELQGPPGEEIREFSEASLEHLGIRAPSRWVSVLAPGHFRSG